MAATTNMNVIAGQGNVIHEVPNVSKQNLELNYGFVAQEAEGKKKQDKTKVQNFETPDKVAIQEDGENRDKKKPQDEREGSKKNKSRCKSSSSQRKRIDIRI